jgi:mRNA-degrading endonuclease RelE of RelBE toxin-antitoxin system
VADEVSGAEAPYEVILTPPARRALAERLPEAVATAVYEFVSGPLARNPHRVGAPLAAPFEGLYRARRGEYRIRYRIEEDRHRVVVFNVAHRRDAYRT